MSREIDLSGTAAADPARSVDQEREAVGEHPDTGGLVTPDHAQAAPGAEAPDDAPDDAPSRDDALPVPGPPG